MANLNSDNCMFSPSRGMCKQKSERGKNYVQCHGIKCINYKVKIRK